MYCDYEALKDYAISLNKDFNNCTKAIMGIENSFKTITNINTWNSDTRDYYLEMVNKILTNFDIINNKFNNINQYIDSVITNYQEAEREMMGVFGNG